MLKMPLCPTDINGRKIKEGLSNNPLTPSPINTFGDRFVKGKIRRG